MPLKLLLLPLLTLGLTLALACGGDDDDDDNDDTGGNGEPTAEAPNGDDGAADGRFEGGSATLTIGDETWAFDGLTCVFSPEEAGADNVAFRVSSFTETADGTQLLVTAMIIDETGEGQTEGEDLIRSVSIIDFDNTQDRTVNWSTIGRLITNVEQEWTIDGKSVHVEGVFDDRNTIDVVEVPGTFDATCE